MLKPPIGTRPIPYTYSGRPFGIEVSEKFDVWLDEEDQLIFVTEAFRQHHAFVTMSPGPEGPVWTARPPEGSGQRCRTGREALDHACLYILSARDDADHNHSARMAMRMLLRDIERN